MRRLINSCFGLGFLPIAPGTWGSLPTAIIFYLLCACAAPLAEINVIMLALAVIGSVSCIVYASASIAATSKLDPSEVVMDEFAGQAVTFLSLTALAPHTAIIAAILGFLLFRFFDILKPWPVYKLEALPAGLGILADDLMAGLYAAIVFNLCTFLGIIAYFSKLLNNILRLA
jgi:phosphatidylglycerophosphatase A